jgi:hypothetical protein
MKVSNLIYLATTISTDTEHCHRYGQANQSIEKDVPEKNVPAECDRHHRLEVLSVDF